MFVFLSKFLPQFVYPLGLVSLLLVAALAVGRRPRVRNAALIISLALIWIGGNRWVADALIRSLEWRYLPPAALPHAEAIVVLGGGTDPMVYPRSTTEINSAGDRIIYAARLYKQGAAPHLLLSGGYITWTEDRPSTPAQEMADLLHLMDVPDTALWLQNHSQNTYEDALYSSQMLKEKGITRVILITSAMHMPRAVELFRADGIDVIPAPTDYSVTAADFRSLTWDSLPGFLINLVPDVSSLRGTSTVLKEYIGLSVSGLQGSFSPGE
ncbi:MAG TPA: YdcF family protein [Anaerolineaceae bacterium]|jgi:uncharacterized SAM-binding protein YcdF (DUF218 family)